MSSQTVALTPHAQTETSNTRKKKTYLQQFVDAKHFKAHAATVDPGRGAVPKPKSRRLRSVPLRGGNRVFCRGKSLAFGASSPIFAVDSLSWRRRGPGRLLRLAELPIESRRLNSPGVNCMFPDHYVPQMRSTTGRLSTLHERDTSNRSC